MDSRAERGVRELDRLDEAVTRGDFRLNFARGLDEDRAHPGMLGIAIVVAFVLERVTLGMIEASTTRKPSIPCTRPYWSTTAM